MTLALAVGTPWFMIVHTDRVQYAELSGAGCTGYALAHSFQSVASSGSLCTARFMYNQAPPYRCVSSGKESL